MHNKSPHGRTDHHHGNRNCWSNGLQERDTQNIWIKKWTRELTTGRGMTKGSKKVRFIFSKDLVIRALSRTIETGLNSQVKLVSIAR